MSSDHPLAGKSALVTGASSGIGREAARSLARRLSEGGEVSAGQLILLGERTRGAEKGLPYSKKSRPDVLIPIR